MDIYASDDEKGEEIKQWWRDNGRTVVIGSIFAFAAVASGRYWVSYQHTLAENASMTYQQVSVALANDNEVEAAERTQQLFAESATTPYAVFAALEMASRAVEMSDTDAAASYLQWVMDNATLASHVEIARLRLAQLLLNDKNYDQALVLVNQSKSISFSSLFSELRGDILAAQGQDQAALTAYQIAIVKLAQGDSRQGLLQMKIDDMAVSNDG